MPTAQESLAGTYELLNDEFTRPEDSDPAKRGAYKRPLTGNPDAHLMVTYRRGDLVKLSDEEARRLLAGPRPAVGKPGEAEARQLAVLEAQVEQLKARQEQLKAEAEAREAAAAEPWNGDPRYHTPQPGYVAQTADVPPLPEGLDPLLAGSAESELPPSPEERYKSGDVERAGGPAGAVQAAQGLLGPTAAGPSGPLTARTREDIAAASGKGKAKSAGKGKPEGGSAGSTG